MYVIAGHSRRCEQELIKGLTVSLRPGQKLVAEEGVVLPRFAVSSELLLEGRHLLSICGVCELECIINTASFWADKM